MISIRCVGLLRCPRSQPRAAMLCCRPALSAAHTPATDAHGTWLFVTPTHQAAYELFEETIAALPPGPQHLVVLSGVPLIFPAVGAPSRQISPVQPVQPHAGMCLPCSSLSHEA